MSLISRALALLLLCALPACSLAPKYERPAIDLPEEWRKIDLGTLPLNVDWWTRFDDPVLTALVEEALRNNQDLAESLANIHSAAAQAGVGSSALFPNLTGDASATSQGASDALPNQQPLDATGADRWTTLYSAGLTAAWEFDLWGKYRNQYRMLTDVLLNTVAGHEALRLSVAGQTAQTYFQLLALDMQLDTARRTLKTREEAFRIYTSRYEQGDITELDWQRAKAEVETARAQVHTSTISVDRTEAALAVLVGRSPRDIINRAMARGKPIISLPAPPVLPADLPSTLLMRRPDIRAAEYLIMGYNANIGVARAQFFPSISLSAAVGLTSAGFLQMFKPTAEAATGSYGASGTIPLLDFGRNWYNLKQAEAQKKASIAVYRKTVQSAFQDVRTALTAQREADAIVKSMQAQVDSLRRAADIAQLQYDNGYTDYLTVLDAQRQLFSSELSLATALQNRLNAIVSVCQALGGGWDEPGAKPGFPPFNNTERLVREETNAGKLDKANSAKTSGGALPQESAQSQRR